MSTASHRVKIIAAAGVVAAATLAALPVHAQTEFFKNPLGSGNTIQTPINLIEKIETFLLGLSAPLVLLALTYGGIMLTFGGVDPGQAKRAKTIIFWALIGLAVILVRVPIKGLVAGDILAQPGESPMASEALGILIRIIKLLFSIVGALALLAVVWGGTLITASFGDEGRTRQGKTAVIYGLIGFAVTALSFTFIELIVYLFS